MRLEAEYELRLGFEGPETVTYGLWPLSGGGRSCWPRPEVPAGIPVFYLFLVLPLGFLGQFALATPLPLGPGQRSPRHEKVPRSGKVLMNMTKGLGEGDTNTKSSLYCPFQWLRKREETQPHLAVPRPRGSCRAVSGSLHTQQRSRGKGERSLLVLPREQEDLKKQADLKRSRESLCTQDQAGTSEVRKAAGLNRWENAWGPRQHCCRGAPGPAGSRD